MLGGGMGCPAHYVVAAILTGCESHPIPHPPHRRVVNKNARLHPHPIRHPVPLAGEHAHPLPHPGGDGLPVAHPVAGGEQVAHGDADATRHPDADAVQVRVSLPMQARDGSNAVSLMLRIRKSLARRVPVEGAGRSGRARPARAALSAFLKLQVAHPRKS